MTEDLTGNGAGEGAPPTEEHHEPESAEPTPTNANGEPSEVSAPPADASAEPSWLEQRPAKANGDAPPPASFAESPWLDPAAAAHAALTPPPLESERPQPPPLPSPMLEPFGDFSGKDLEQAPLRWRELLAVFALVLLCDLTLYHGEGFAGCAVLFAVAPLLLALGAPRPKWSADLLVLAVMLALLSLKLFWQGSPLLVGAGGALLVAFAMTLAGKRPFVLDALLFASQTVPAGYCGLAHYGRSSKKFNPRIGGGIGLSYTLPAAALLVFGALFLLANPDLRAAFSEAVERFLTALKNWITDLAPRLSEIVFWAAVLWIAVGLLRPVFSLAYANGREKQPEPETAAAEAEAETEPAESDRAPLYAAFRNTLVAVIALFAVYLVFEFRTLWFREFPENFPYSGYAHEGAAWLTVALALATAALSLIFRGRILRDPRLPFLRRLAWAWSAANLILALSVYNRLGIYLGFNGMSYMRTIGFFGMTAVVAGFVLVVWKIARDKDFAWLVQRQLWTLALTVYLFGLTPVDRIVTGYNVRCILKGDPAPAVQISVHPIGPEGVPLLLPLLDCDDATIREGVRAMLAARHVVALGQAVHRREQGWTAFQLAERRMLRQLDESQTKWESYTDFATREAALNKFNEYAHQWY